MRNPSLAALARLFIISTETRQLHQPGKGPPNHPTAGQQDEVLGLVRMLNDLQDPTCEGAYPFDHGMVGTAGSDQLPVREAPLELLNNQIGSVPILDTSTIHDYHWNALDAPYFVVLLP